MRPDDIAGGAAFRMALMASTVLALVLCFVGISLYHVLRISMLNDLEAQLAEELSLFKTLHEAEGVDSLTRAFRQLEQPVLAGDRRVGLFDQNGQKLAGNIDLAPPALASEQRLALLSNFDGKLLFVYSAAVASKQLVVAREHRSISLELSSLMRNLIVAGALAFAACLLLGWVLSRRSLTGLSRIARTLEQVASGDAKARVNAGAGKGQIARISHLIDGSLERLSALIESTRNTTRALAHDLRSPLNRAFIIVHEAAQSGDRQALIGAEEALQDLSGIFDTVLRIARLEANEDRSGFRTVDITTVVRDVAAVFDEF